ncbi:putative RNase H-like nuclease (RuvC/YqgF family) [Scopulibacillus daqui]|uniref:RNase H-like nuclease (RuvC/YqgF family) n=1 Tax=Scopulibacillus daqui TaxID=1469162 RepID=A0ABS2PY20_9BACL|nr:hypothetical protein [Scopulibacillus daqui]MBM7644212.1 putative RNase H-like nuclease (RuvC/YqgF family) [Scopulibacillus daqui]
MNKEDKILEHLERLDKTISAVWTDIKEFKGEMHEFKDEMYKFKDEMVEFKKETSNHFKEIDGQLQHLKWDLDVLKESFWENKKEIAGIKKTIVMK